jgi:hypothetical protein
LADNNDKTFDTEVINRLGDFFGEQEQSNPSSDNRNSNVSPDFPLRNLNAIILSIEWEITDQIMTNLIAEVSRLKKIYRNDKIIFPFLQLHGSVGDYIRRKKVTALPGSISLLHSICGGLNRVVTVPEMTEAEKKRTLSEEVNKFKELKKQIIIAKSAVVDKVTPAPSKITRPSPPEKEISHKEPKAKVSPVPTHETIMYALEEIKKVIRAEFKALREELKMKK